MSTTRATRVDVPARRVRHQARDAFVVMAFSLGTSLVLASGLLVLSVLLGPGR